MKTESHEIEHSIQGDCSFATVGCLPLGRLQDDTKDSLDILKEVLTGDHEHVPDKLKKHGYVAVANHRTTWDSINDKQLPDESYPDWMARKVRQERSTFENDLFMKPFVEKKQATLAALVDRISTTYRWHVTQNWLPLTAKRLFKQ